MITVGIDMIPSCIGDAGRVDDLRQLAGALRAGRVRGVRHLLQDLELVSAAPASVSVYGHLGVSYYRVRSAASRWITIPDGGFGWKKVLFCGNVFPSAASFKTCRRSGASRKNALTPAPSSTHLTASLASRV